MPASRFRLEPGDVGQILRSTRRSLVRDEVLEPEDRDCSASELDGDPPRPGPLECHTVDGSEDVDAARRYYMQAAERGNAKAMHNLAVLDADGGGKGADYTSAAQWFRKAAERGVADSQFNLGILCARGIGVEQNLAESYKWFSLAAAQGDVDSGRKRDEVAKRLDPQSLAVAKQAVQTFVPKSQPDDAVNVTSPAGGWDSATAKSPTKTTAKTAAARSASAKPATARQAVR